MSTEEKLAEFVGQDTRYFPTIVSFFITGLILIVFRDIDESLRRHFVPAMIFYTLGTALIAYTHTMLNIRQQMRDKESYIGLPRSKFVLIVIAQFVWFAFFVGYTVYRICNSN